MTQSSSSSQDATTRPIARFSSDVPARLDRLPWSRWHAKIVLALGITWMLDGLEVTLVGAIAPVLAESQTLHLDETQLGAAATAYLGGAVAGALIFGRLTDMYGRKRLFLVTLGLYAGATLLTALSWNFASLAVFRALTGAGIGGEYSAVNSAIDELLPARLRGRADLAVNATYWLGTALGAALTIPLLDPRVLPTAVGWRCAFFVGAIFGAGILLLRHYVPESPRWYLLHGRPQEARRVVRQIEEEVVGHRRARSTAGRSQPVHSNDGPLEDDALPPLGGTGQPATIELEARGNVTFAWVLRVLVHRHPRRTVLGLSLMVAQAFAYNGIFFTYALVLSRFYGVAAKDIGLFLIPFAFGNLLGPIVLGPLFDQIGRRAMISATYMAAGGLMAITGYAMSRGWLTAASQTALWCVVFFVASAAASSAYLTVSELFPVELRGIAIAFFYAVGTGAGGLVAPWLFGWLVQSGSRERVSLGYAVGALLMVAAGLVAMVLGVPAERKSLEQIAALDR